MAGTTAQLIALCCYFNARARGIETGSFFPGNSTCKFCETIQFLKQSSSWFSRSPSWKVVAKTPDEWLERKVETNKSATLVHGDVNDARISDRMSAGFIGGGGRWILAITENNQSELWEARWEVGDRNAPDQRIWRVQYHLVAQHIGGTLPTTRPIHMIRAELQRSLENTLAFAKENRIDFFPQCFQKAIDCLSADNPVDLANEKELSPPGLLGIQAMQLLAACDIAWVFGGMGSWNDLGFDGEEQSRYEKLSDLLFSLVNEGICAGVNSGALAPS